MAKKQSELSARGKPRGKKEKHIPDSQIDFSDISELTDEQLKGARRVGRPKSDNPKQLIAVRMSPQLLANLKKLAKAVGQKKVQMAPKKEAEKLTGLQTGGISALALMHKNFPVYIDRPAFDLDRILVSAGKRGVNLELPVPDLIKITKAKPVDVTISN